MTKQEAIEKHRKLQDWLSKNPDKEIYDWPEWEYNGGIEKHIRQNCFLCQHTDFDCCILEWPGIKYDPSPHCIVYKPWTNEGLFSQWEDNQVIDLKKRTKLVEQIRDLPEKKQISAFIDRELIKYKNQIR